MFHIQAPDAVAYQPPGLVTPPEADAPQRPLVAAISAATRRDAALELMRRRRARHTLLEYARAIEIPGKPVNKDGAEDSELFVPVETALAPHHVLIMRAIERAMDTHDGRLMIFAPPGSAKSTYASVIAPVRKLQKIPGYRIILASYNTKIAAKQSRKARALARQRRAVNIWPDRPFLAYDQKAVDQWALTNGSEFMAYGILSGITGNRANGVLIDDPVKSRLEADSETIRDRIFEEYQDAITTRLLPGGWIILIMTRWHPDDLAGRILPDDYDGQSGEIRCKDGQVWEVLNLTAKCERDDDPLGRAIGEYIWPEWFPVTHWAKWENNPAAARTWSALCQQRPSLGEGLEFKREWFKWFDPDAEPGSPDGVPEKMTMYAATDFATKEDKSDFSEHGVAGLDLNMHLWIVDWWYGQKTTDITIAHAIDMIARHNPWRWWDEGGPIDNALRPHFTAAMREAEPPVYVELESKTSIKNKALKLQSFQARVAQGKVHLPLNRPWAKRLVDQLCAFPAVKNDDACDVCGLLGRGIDDMIQPHRPVVQEKKVLKPFTGEWVEYSDEPKLAPRYT